MTRLAAALWILVFWGSVLLLVAAATQRIIL